MRFSSCPSHSCAASRTKNVEASVIHLFSPVLECDRDDIPLTCLRWSDTRAAAFPSQPAHHLESRARRKVVHRMRSQSGPFVRPYSMQALANCSNLAALICISRECRWSNAHGGGNNLRPATPQRRRDLRHLEG